MPLSLAELMLYTTVKVSSFVQSTPTGTGTGFFWSICNNDKIVILLVTNRHVIVNCNRLEIVSHLSTNIYNESPSGEFKLVSLAVNPSTTIMHPDPNVDLCVIAYQNAMNDAAAAGTPLFLRALSAENVPTTDQWSDFDVIEDILMVGCPRGIYDEANNFPIVRRGITATAMSRDYNQKPEFMVDMACFPGSSGSPVFIKQLGYVDKKTNNYMMDQTRFFFVGVLYSGPLITNKGEIKLGGIPTVEVAAMMHLGQVIKSSMMITFDDLIKPNLKAN